VYVTSGRDTEVRLTIEALVDLVNALADAASDPDAEDVDVRTLLHEHRFSRAAGASRAAIDRVEERVGSMVDTLRLLRGFRGMQFPLAGCLVVRFAERCRVRLTQFTRPIFVPIGISLISYTT
jgi:hypothetical protein